MGEPSGAAAGQLTWSGMFLAPSVPNVARCTLGAGCDGAPSAGTAAIESIPVVATIALTSMETVRFPHTAMGRMLRRGRGRAHGAEGPAVGNTSTVLTG